MKYLINSIDTYRVDTVEEVEALHQELKDSNMFELLAFSYKTKDVKVKGEVVDSYQLVQAKKVFTSEKDPDRTLEIKYEVPHDAF